MSRDRRGSARPDDLPGANRPTTIDRTTEPNAAVGDRAGTVLDPAVVLRGMRRLTPDHRAALIEVHYRGRSVAEASHALGIPTSTVKSRLYYALRSLSLIFEEEQHAQQEGISRIGLEPASPSGSDSVGQIRQAGRAGRMNRLALNVLPQQPLDPVDHGKPDCGDLMRGFAPGSDKEAGT